MNHFKVPIHWKTVVITYSGNVCYFLLFGFRKKKKKELDQRNTTIN